MKSSTKIKKNKKERKVKAWAIIDKKGRLGQTQNSGVVFASKKDAKQIAQLWGEEEEIISVTITYKL